MHQINQFTHVPALRKVHQHALPPQEHRAPARRVALAQLPDLRDAAHDLLVRAEVAPVVHLHGCVCARVCVRVCVCDVCVRVRR